MTVRVSKPAFNLREKLSELDRPVGNHGSQLMRSVDTEESFNLIRAGRKNIIINGEQKIWQRGTSISSPAGTGLIFGSDRWMFEEGCGELVATVSRSADTPVGEGFQYSAQINVDTVESTISGDFAQYMYFVEGYDAAHLEWGTAHAKPVTLSFWFKTTVSGDHYVTINSSGGVDTWSTVIHSPTNAWKKHVVTIDPPTSGTWLNDHRRGIEIRIGLCNSSSVAVSDWDKWYYGGGAYNGFSTAHSNLILTQNNKAWLTGVQLEEGNVATPFEFRSYGEELALCERYYERYWQNNNVLGPGGGGGDGYNTISAGAHNGSNGYYTWRFSTQKRARPSVDYAGKFRVIGGSSIANQVPNEFYSPGADGARIRVNHSGSSGQAFILEFDGNNSSTGYLEASAEL